jgi:WD40 repeat protein
MRKWLIGLCGLIYTLVALAFPPRTVMEAACVGGGGDGLAIAPDGKTVMVYRSNGQSTVWDLGTGDRLGSHFFAGHSGWIVSLAFSPDGKNLLTGGLDHKVLLWDVATGLPVRVFSGHTEQVNVVAFSPDGKTILSGSNDRTVR